MKHTLDYASPPKYASYNRRHNLNFGKEIGITQSEFEKLSLMPCHYCGVEGPNGIDRVNNNFGYKPENCVPACKHCNYVKGNLSVEDFEVWSKRFVNHQNKSKQLNIKNAPHGGRYV